MTKRPRRQTSIDAHESIKPIKKDHYDKIVEALKKLKVGGNYEEISAAAGMEPLQVARRLDEMVKANIAYNCEYTHKTKSGRSAMVRQLIGLGYKNEGGEPVNKKKEVVVQKLPPVKKESPQLEIF